MPEASISVGTPGGYCATQKRWFAPDASPVATVLIGSMRGRGARLRLGEQRGQRRPNVCEHVRFSRSIWMQTIRLHQLRMQRDAVEQEGYQREVVLLCERAIHHEEFARVAGSVIG